MRVLGVDPGLRNMGWGVIEAVGSRITHVANGVCHSSGEDLATRLVSLYTQMTDVVHEYQPDAAAVENTFVNKDGVGTLKLGQARAIALVMAFLTMMPATCFLNSTGPRVSATGSDASTAAVTAALIAASSSVLPTNASTASSQ